MDSKKNHIFNKQNKTHSISSVLIKLLHYYTAYIININKSNIQLLFLPVILKFFNF